LRHRSRGPLKIKIAFIFSILIAIAFGLNWMVASETIRGEKVADLERVLKHILIENAEEYIHTPLTSESDLAFLHLIPHTEMILSDSEANTLRFIVTKAPYVPLEKEIAASHKLSNGYYLSAISDDNKVNAAVDKYAQKLLIRYLFSLFVILLISIFLLDYFMKPLAVLAQKTRDWNTKEPFDFALDNPGKEIEEVSYAFSALIGRLENYHTKEAELFKEAAHELKTPLAMMRSRLDVYQNNNDYSKDKFTDDLGHDIERLTSELKNVLFLESSDFEEASTVDIVNTFQMLKTKMEILIQRKQLTLQLPKDSFSVIAPKKLLLKVLSALLENAITYAQENTTVEIGCDPIGRTVIIINTIGAEKYLFSSKIGEKMLRRLSNELGFDYTIQSNEQHFRIDLIFKTDI